MKRALLVFTQESMIERLRDLLPNASTVEWMLNLVALSTSAAEIAPRLREYGRELLDADYPDEQLHVDLMRAYKAVDELGDEERGDAVLDAIDSLTGWWCPPGACLYSPASDKGVLRSSERNIHILM